MSATPLLLHFPLEPQAGEEADVSAQIVWVDPLPEDDEADRRAAIRDWYDDFVKELRAEEAARNVLAVLRVRGIAVPDAVRVRIVSEKDPERLERWHERAVVAASASEVIDEPS